MKHFFAFALTLVHALGLFAQNQIPVISNLQLFPDVPNNSALLQFELTDAENDPLEVSVQVSSDGGKTYSTLSGANLSGDVGFPVATGLRSATCTGLNFPASGKFSFRVIADDKQAFDIQLLVNEVDSNRLINDLKFVEGIRHRSTGLAHLNATRDYMQQHFEQLGLVFEKQTFPFSTTSGQNLIGSLAGTASAEKVVIVDAHYDTVSNAPGADDNGSGTVGVMEISRLLSRYPSKKTQRYIGFDLEESGLVGSVNYVNSGIPAAEQIEGVFNFEMIGFWSDQPNTQELPAGFEILFPIQALEVAGNQNRGDFITNVGNANSQSLINLFSNSAQQYVPALKVISLAVPGNGQVVPDLRRSDHTPFWESNRKALMLTDGANFRNECYHTPLDMAEDKLSFTFMANVVKATLASMAQLVEIQHADWASTSFQLGSPSFEATPCGYKIIQQQGLYLEAASCFEEAVVVEIFDMKGSLISSQQVQLAETAVPLYNSKLAAGAYAVTIRHSHGIFSQKVLIR